MGKKSYYTFLSRKKKKKLQVLMLKNIIKLLKKLFEIQKYRQKFKKWNNYFLLMLFKINYRFIYTS